MKKYRVITDGVRYRVQRMLFGFIPITEEYYETKVMARVPTNFFSLEDALIYIRDKVKPTRKPHNEWVVIWKDYKRI